jgi:peptidoglycan hydrolase CwlO-like protein
LQIKQEVECERSKSEFLKKEIKDIKHKIEKQKDSLKTVQR